MPDGGSSDKAVSILQSFRNFATEQKKYPVLIIDEANQVLEGGSGWHHQLSGRNCGGNQTE